MKQQEETVSIGMWMFLVQEIMFFGGLFTVYLVFRSKFPMAFAAGSNHLDAFLGRPEHACPDRQQLDDGSDGLLCAAKATEYAGHADPADDGRSARPFSALRRSNTPINTITACSRGRVEPDHQERLRERRRDEPAASRHSGEEHAYVNPRGEFQWHEFELMNTLRPSRRPNPNGNYLTEYEKIGYFSNGQIDDEQVPRQGTDIFLDLFCDDRASRPAHDRRPWADDVAVVDGLEGLLYGRLLYAGRDVGALLALCRYCLDLSVPAALFAWAGTLYIRRINGGYS